MRTLSSAVNYAVTIPLVSGLGHSGSAVNFTVAAIVVFEFLYVILCNA
jgi:homoserine kinase